MAVSNESVLVTVVPSAGSGFERKRFELNSKNEKSIRFGRNKKDSDYVLEMPGASWNHAVVKLWPEGTAPGGAVLGVRDLSTNGCGIKLPSGEIKKLQKDRDEPLQHGSVIIIPMKVKDANLRVSFSINVGGDCDSSQASETQKSTLPKEPSVHVGDDADKLMQEASSDKKSNHEKDKLVTADEGADTKNPPPGPHDHHVDKDEEMGHRSQTTVSSQPNVHEQNLDTKCRSPDEPHDPPTRHGRGDAAEYVPSPSPSRRRRYRSRSRHSQHLSPPHKSKNRSRSRHSQSPSPSRKSKHRSRSRHSQQIEALEVYHHSDSDMEVTQSNGVSKTNDAPDLLEQFRRMLSTDPSMARSVLASMQEQISPQGTQASSTSHAALVDLEPGEREKEDEAKADEKAEEILALVDLEAGEPEKKDKAKADNAAEEMMARCLAFAQQREEERLATARNEKERPESFIHIKKERQEKSSEESSFLHVKKERVEKSSEQSSFLHVKKERVEKSSEESSFLHVKKERQETASEESSFLHVKKERQEKSSEEPAILLQEDETAQATSAQPPNASLEDDSCVVVAETKQPSDDVCIEVAESKEDKKAKADKIVEDMMARCQAFAREKIEFRINKNEVDKLATPTSRPAPLGPPAAFAPLGPPAALRPAGAAEKEEEMRKHEEALARKREERKKRDEVDRRERKQREEVERRERKEREEEERRARRKREEKEDEERRARKKREESERRRRKEREEADRKKEEKAQQDKIQADIMSRINSFARQKEQERNAPTMKQETASAAYKPAHVYIDVEATEKQRRRDSSRKLKRSRSRGEKKGSRSLKRRSRSRSRSFRRKSRSRSRKRKRSRSRSRSLRKRSRSRSRSLKKRARSRSRSLRKRSRSRSRSLRKRSADHADPQYVSVSDRNNNMAKPQSEKPQEKAEDMPSFEEYIASAAQKRLREAIESRDPVALKAAMKAADDAKRALEAREAGNKGRSESSSKEGPKEVLEAQNAGSSGSSKQIDPREALEISERSRSMALSAKDAGNAAFQAQNFEKALKHYSQAIEFDPSEAVFFSNRSGAYASLSRYSEALADAEQCVRLRPDWWKGYSRKGTAEFHLERLADSERSYVKGLGLLPGEPSLKEGLAQVRTKKAIMSGRSSRY